MKTIVRTGLYCTAASLAIVGFAIAMDIGGGRALWPWPDSRMSYIFIGSMLLAQAGALFWQARSLELNAAMGGAIGYGLMNAGFVFLMGSLDLQTRDLRSLGWAITAMVLTLGAIAVLLLRNHFPVTRSSATPPIVRWSFLVIAVALVIATVMLLARSPIVFPWPLKPESSIAFGLMFLGSAVYFIDGFARPYWGNAIGQLLAFLIYDLVLIYPWLSHFPKAKDGFLISLVIYVAVLLWSGYLAIRYLLVERGTRIIGERVGA